MEKVMETMNEMFDEEGVTEQYTCLNCGWEGCEDELVMSDNETDNVYCPVCYSEDVVSN